mmetsp:Transcript_86307/g.217244  ORF Transcript_86307/g.217244 Transcript_86307/m.217244 type:complete len:212 (+) Transcript_86307:388-1023(+)
MEGGERPVAAGVRRHLAHGLCQRRRVLPMGARAPPRLRLLRRHRLGAHLHPRRGAVAALRLPGPPLRGAVRELGAGRRRPPGQHRQRWRRPRHAPRHGRLRQRRGRVEVRRGGVDAGDAVARPRAYGLGAEGGVAPRRLEYSGFGLLGQDGGHLEAGDGRPPVEAALQAARGGLRGERGLVRDRQYPRRVLRRGRGRAVEGGRRREVRGGR